MPRFNSDNLIKYLLPLVALFCIAGCASDNETDKASQAEIIAFQQATTIPKISKIRATVLKDTARSIGAQAALSWAADQYNFMLENNAKNLKTVFNFSALMLDQNIVAPVLEESNNILNQDSDDAIRLADKTYTIAAPARFVTAAPLWRDYLIMHFDKPEPPDNSLLPKNNYERDLWNQYIIMGWNEGVDQAKETFKINLNRLTRDIKGMILYRKLLAQNIVTPPFVSTANLGITGGGTALRINDRVLRITAVSELKADSNTWKARVHK